MLAQRLARRGLGGALLVLSCLACGADDAPPPLDETRSSFGGADAGGAGMSGTSGQGGAGDIKLSGGSQPEVCNGLDDDRDGVIDEGCPCSDGASQACHGGDPKQAGVGACAMGVQRCEAAVSGEVSVIAWGVCEGSVAPSSEVCADGVDNDCDGSVDEGCPSGGEGGAGQGGAAGGDGGPAGGGQGGSGAAGAPVDTTGLDAHCAVGRALQVGCGRIIVWGDEHVTLDSYWPQQKPFWSQVLPWLAAKPEGCGAPLTSVQSPTKGLSELADALSLTVSDQGAWSIPTAGEPHEIRVFEAYSSTPEMGASLFQWVSEGGAAFVTTVGYGSEEECTTENPLLAPFGLAYSCVESSPWGPVESVTSHPSMSGVDPASIPFVNGVYVAELGDGNKSSVLASIFSGGVCPSP